MMNTFHSIAGGELAKLIAHHDWSNTAMGAPSNWPDTLAVTTEMMLCSALPKFIAWGPDLELVYNDAYLAILGSKHPGALGAKMRSVWHEVWEEVTALVDRVWTGESFYIENAPFLIEHDDGLKQKWISFSYVPLYAGASVAGFLCELVDNTVLVQLDRARKAEHKRLELRFEQSPAMIAVVRGSDYTFDYANENYRRFMGGRELIGKRAVEALPELDEQGFIGLLDQVFINGEVYRADGVPIAVRTPSGAMENRFVSFVYQPTYNETGAIDGVLAEGFDVTPLASAAAAIHDSEQRLRQLANTIPQLAWMANRDGEIHWYNDRWYAYTGTTLGEMAGWGWQQVHHPDFLPLVLERWRECLDTGEQFEMTFPLKGKDGSFCQFYTLVAPLRNEAGDIVQWFGTNTDVSKLQLVQETLKKTEEWLEAGLAVGRMVVWEWDFATNEAKYSDNSREVLGYSDSHTSQGWSTIHPEDVPSLRAMIDEAISARAGFSATTRRIRPDTGATIWVETKGRVMCDAAGRAIGMRGIMVDQTARHLAELDLREANRRKDEFLAMLAHELRNPLAPISSAAALLNMIGKNNPAIAKPSEVITRQVSHMRALIDDLLDVSRVTRGLVELNKDTVDLCAVARLAAEQVGPLIQSRNQRLNLSIPVEPIVFVGDAPRMTQVIANILHNAAKYTPQDGKISLEVKTIGADATVIVTDNGSGIDADLLPRIFDLFSQAIRTPDRFQGGLGLGLALVKSIVALHGGTVLAKSDGPGLGSAFEVTVPNVMASLPESARACTSAQAPAARARKIVVVDDNRDAADALTALLVVTGHDVQAFYDAEALLGVLDNVSADVFILDIGLPELDGYELARRIRACERHDEAILIALTGYGQAHDKALALRAGFNYHLVKPVELSNLQAILALA